MSTEKLSELSNNARKAANSFYNWSQLANCTSERLSCLTVEQLKETSELFSNLLAGLEAKDERIGELEAKLATPVRLPLLYSPDPWMSPDPDGTWLDKEDVKKSIRTAGFTVEGDE